ncbi:MAG TPA: calcium-binding EGF-like domain-containing protein [Polyangiaceae bacterium LLY-WYZ-14_1]|nr:calcium-binding EGF-like domain-containing protein [Polyangiaceae bacterium LLY-WYZ-14_1]
MIWSTFIACGQGGPRDRLDAGDGGDAFAVGPDADGGPDAKAPHDAATADASGAPDALDGGRDAGAPSDPLRVPPGETRQLGAAGISYFDPEVLSSPPLMTFTDQARTVWLAELDPVTGDLVSADGRDLAIDVGHAPLGATNNGPEFGVDENGWSIVYSKAVGGRIHTHQAFVEGADVTTSAVTSGTPILGAVASKAPEASSVHVLAVRGAWNDGEAVWLDLARPDHQVPWASAVEDTDGRWIDGALLAVHMVRDPPHDGQLALFDPRTETSTPITDDDTAKERPFGWFAPEAEGAIRVLAIVDGGTAIGVYEQRADGPWPQVLRVSLPAGSGGTRFSSPEPFVVNGRSFASVSVVNDSTTPRDSQTWIVDLADPEGPGTVRCDDGGPQPVLRADPEVLIGEEQVFLYWYRFTGGPVTLHRCASGLRTGDCPCLNGGACLPMDRCACPPGTTGDRCESVHRAEGGGRRDRHG